MARKALVDGLVRYDEAYGWHGTLKTIDIGQDWGVPLADIPAYGDIKPWVLAVALDVSNAAIRIGLQPERDKSGAIVADRRTGAVTVEGARWTGRGLKGLVKPGDVFYVEPIAGREGEYRLRQIPEVSGACIAMDPFTGRVLAMVGGFSFDESEFNRATQAQRQPGSSFKPFVYAAALDNGYTPSSIIVDAPVTIDDGSGQLWTPANFEGKSSRAAHVAVRRRAFDQPDDGQARARHRHAADRRIRQALRHLRQSAAVPVDVDRRGRDDRAAHDHRLLDVRQRRQASESDADRSDPGSLGQYDLQARRTHLRGVRRPGMEQSARAAA